MAYQDDYDYYPGYETYYSRNRHEYIYRDGDRWVRRSEPRGVTVTALFSAPAVRLDFHDSPEQHHNTVVQAYPRNWTPLGRHQDEREVRRDTRLDDPRDDARNRPVSMIANDDYDYYPGYETYYSRNRREFVYREGNTWVRRPQPAGVAPSVLFAAPAVHLDFHDSPEQHHATVVQQYPRNWNRQNGKHDEQDDRRNERRDEKRDRQDDERKQ